MPPVQTSKQRIKHDADMPDVPAKCPCDDCVDAVEAAALAAIREVWNSRLPYTIESEQPRGSWNANPPCVVCGLRFLAEYGPFIRISFYTYSPLSVSDPIPFRHVKKVLLHHSCAEIALQQGATNLGGTQGADEASRYYALLLKLMSEEKSLGRRMARLISEDPGK